MQDVQAAFDGARQLADAGRHAEVIEHLDRCPRGVIEETPEASLLYGTAHARQGRHAEGVRWVELAIDRARHRGEGPLETRALNARGGIAFVTGCIDDAADYFTKALMAASRDGDHATIGRCSNNIGSVSSLRGRHAEGIWSYTMAMSAFQRAALRRGVAEASHNAAIAYREQGDLEQALQHAVFAHEEANVGGDEWLVNTTLRGQAEIYVLRGELGIARHQIDRALFAHREMGDPIEEAEDLRVVASILAMEGETDQAEKMLRKVVATATAQQRPHVVAEATRDLAYVLRKLGRVDEAVGAARTAVAAFERLGAEAEIRKLDSQEWGYPLANELRKALRPLHEAQRLADAGEYAKLVGYLGERPVEELERSPTLALLNGIGHTRLGRLNTGWQWTVIALTRARALGDRKIEVRALNVYGAIALEQGGIEAARGFFMQAQAEAMRDGDLTTVGRSANNLGIVANMQGDHGRAIGAYTMAIAAYQKAGFERGAVESHHNLGITHCEQGNLIQAMRAADMAVQEADRIGDVALKAQALAGRAEIRIACKESEIAIREAERAVALHRDLGDEVRESEDLRILANALATVGKVDEAIKILHQVAHRARKHSRMVLLAVAQRDLATALARVERMDEAAEAAEKARSAFESLGASRQAERMEEFLASKV